MVRAEERSAAEVKDAPADSADPFSYTSTTSPADVPGAMLPKFAELVRSGDLHHQLHGTMMVRKLLSVESPLINDVIAADVGPSFVGFLGRHDQSPLQAEAAGALAAIAAGRREPVAYLFRINAAPSLVQLLRSPDANCRGNAAWAVGNLAVENAECRDHLLQLGAVEALLFALDQPCDVPEVPRDTLWALCGLCYGKPPPDLETLAPAIPTLVRLLDHDDDEMVKVAAWALSYLSDGSNDVLARILAHNPLPPLMRLLNSPTSTLAGNQTQATEAPTLTAAGTVVAQLVDSTAPLLLPILRTLSNVVTGDDTQTQEVLDAGVLRSFEALLVHTDPRFRREACFALSNVLAGPAEQIQLVIDECLLPILLQRCLHASEAEVEKEALWAVANCTSQGAPRQFEYLVAIGVLDALQKKLFECSNPKLLVLALEAVGNVLAQGETRRQEADLDWNPFGARIDVEALARQLDAFESHECDDVIQLATHLLGQYFPEWSSDD